jgi:excisionase family DNA binding protein
MAVRRQYTPGEVADLLGVSRSTVRRLIRCGALRAYQLAGTRQFRVEPADLEEYFRVSRYEPPEALSEPVIYETSPEMARLAHTVLLDAHKRKAG